MKKVLLSLSSAFAVLAVTTSLMTTTTSCKKDDVAPVSTTVPSAITSSSISVSEEVNPGTVVTLNAAFTNGASPFKTYTLYQGSNIVPAYNGISITTSTSSISPVITLSTVSGTYTYSVQFTDAAGSTYSTPSFTVTVSSNLNSYSNVVLGDDQASTGSFYSTSDNSVYTTSTATANSSKIDFIYGTGTVSGNYFFYGNANDAAVTLLFSTVSNSGFTKNGTEFYNTTITSTSFDALNTNKDLKPYLNGNLTSDKTRYKTNNATGDAFVFKTASGKYGIVYVTNNSGSASSPKGTTVTLKVKVQK